MAELSLLNESDIIQGLINVLQDNAKSQDFFGKINELKKCVQLMDIAAGDQTWRQMAATLKKGMDFSQQVHQAMKDRQEIDRLSGQIYNLCQAILGIIRGQTINYAVYLTINGEMQRLVLEKIPVDNFHLSSSGDLRFNLSQEEFKKLQEQTKFPLSVGQHYAELVSTLQQTYWYKRKSTIPNRYINQGVIAEAFEEHLQGTGEDKIPPGITDTWNNIKAWGLINGVLKDRTAWYVQGDVGNTQVKNITSGALTVSSVSSLQDIANLLIQLGNLTMESLPQMAKLVSQKMKLVEIETKVTKRIEKEMRKMVREELKLKQI